MSAGIIISRIGNHIVEIPMSLLVELQAERKQRIIDTLAVLASAHHYMVNLEHIDPRDYIRPMDNDA